LTKIGRSIAADFPLTLVHDHAAEAKAVGRRVTVPHDAAAVTADSTEAAE
jgi:hypothetical protein